ncbi:uncharacterized protein K444DRAFT_620550 [Hyaloscypha bicolor E]|uniref:Uncharacterized protein n=1 Tax=Hyaloscypha bicolor E TaxID=1095630 RepID=A0A2J6SL47_9HELO|nr:uncharacterized protein K444DRAFT_620550 [Hyaloscypha bicolor E]PMD51440.1 hypothetical protein K444DRAFT_620550 [Hyaloscypha bicolor E]
MTRVSTRLIILILMIEYINLLPDGFQSCVKNEEIDGKTLNTKPPNIHQIVFPARMLQVNEAHKAIDKERGLSNNHQRNQSF